MNFGYFGEFFSGIPVYHCPRLADSVLTLPVQKDTLIKTLNNGNRTQWIRIRVWLQTELDDRKFCYQFIAYYNYNKICDILGFLKSKHKKFQEPFFLAVKKKKKKKTSKRAWKGLNSTSDAQFTAQPLVKHLFDLRAPSSTDVPVLLLNQLS